MTRLKGGATSIALFVLATALSLECTLAQTGENQATSARPPPTTPLSPASFPWPSQFDEGGQAFTIYPPQLSRWQADRLEGQAAVAVQPSGADKPVFGVMWLSARTEVDSAGMVKVKDISASRASFPTAGVNAGAYLDAIRRHLSAVTWTIARERLESDLAIERASRETQSQPLGNAAPRIVYSDSPAILVPVDGTPQLREMAGLNLLRVINTRALLLQDKTTRRYYLFVAGHWLEAPQIEGPWTEAYVRPTTLEEAKQQALRNGQVELVEGDESNAERAPVVYVTTSPAELVQTDGPPQYSPIQGTNLLYVTNTPNRLFFDLASQKYYLLLSGRWFRAGALNQSNWEYVAGNSLPADFAQIPQGHPTESVRASVPGTPQAQEAVIANGVPQVASVKRNAATLEVTYDGPPQFQPIEGTALQYVINSPVPVIQVDPGSYYALDNSVWFVSNSPFGPWAVATSVPAVIYSIPRSSPLHYVTYVRVYDATSEVVYEGYYPGYVGSYVAPGATVVYGSGWYYQPWIGTVWYGPPVTWGFGFSIYGSWWNPWPWGPWWGIGFGFGWWGGYPCYHPWWGPWVAPVAVAPVVVVPHGAVVVSHTHGGGTIRNGSVNSAHTNGNVTHIFQRWGGNVATPMGAPSRFAGTGNGVRSAGDWSQRANWRAAGSPTQNTTGPHSFGPRTASETPGFSGGAARPSGGTAPGASNQNLQSFRRTGGQWQRFAGDGRWENMTAPNPNAANAMRQTPAPQGGGTRTAGQSTPSSNPQVATGTQGNRWSNRWSGASEAHSAAPGAPGRPLPSGARFNRGASMGEVPPMGRSGGAWVPNQAGTGPGGAATGGNRAGGGRPMMGGHGQAAWGAGGSGHMGGASTR